MRTVRPLTVGALAAAGLALGAGSADAHVTVDPSTAAPGSYSVLTFRVPNESTTAGTVGLSIALPTATPLASVRYRTVPGWTAKAVTSILRKPVTQGKITITAPVTSVTFIAAAGTRIAPGEFAEFDLSVGPLPDTASLSFPTAQRYDDGSVVNWSDPAPTAGTEEPEHPAPTLTLSAAGAVRTADNTARILGVGGIVIGALSLLMSALGLRRPRGRPAAAAGDPVTP
jgi:uncharacterized protein YcnI